MKSKILILISILIFSFVYFISVGRFVHGKKVPHGDDTAFLATSIEIKQNGSILGFIPSILNRTYKEDNRHPLYMLILSTFASEEPSFYSKAKFLSAIIGWAVILTFYLFLLRSSNKTYAFAIALLTSTNYFFLDHLSKVQAEGLLMIFGIIFCYLIIKKDKTKTTYILLGVVSALGYLTKVTFVLFIGAFLLSELYLIFKERKINNKFKANLGNLTIFCLFFSLISSPLLIRNFLVYKSPFYNYNSSLLFIENAAQRRSTSAIEDRYDLDENPDAKKSTSALAFSFFKTQTINDIAWRLYQGNVGEIVIFSQILLFENLRISIALVLMLLIMIGFYYEKSIYSRIFLISSFVIFQLFFAWYNSISGHYRYLLPVVPLIYYAIFLFLNKFKLSKFLFISLFLFSIIYTSIYVAKDHNENGEFSIYSTYVPSSSQKELLEWQQKNLANSQLFGSGPTRDHQVEWLTGLKRVAIEMPVVESIEELTQFYLKHNIRYVIIDGDVVNSRLDVLRPFWEVSNTNKIKTKQVPDRWKKVFQNQEGETKFIIYEIQ